jgi:hypothetical protein
MLIGNADGALERVVSILQEQLNLPFKGAYAGRSYSRKLVTA